MSYSSTTISLSLNLILMMLVGGLTSQSIAGPLEAPASPTNSASAMFTLQDIYNRITLGAQGSLRTGGFAEPSAGPTNGTGHTLNDIMNALPRPTNAVVAATAADVPSGLIFWGLTESGWGLQTGTAPVELLKVRPAATVVHRLASIAGLPTATGGTGSFTGSFTVSGISAVKVADKNGNEMTVVQAQDNQVQFTIPPGTGINRYTLSISNRVVQPLYYLPSESNGLFLSYDAPLITRVSGCAEDISPVAAGCAVAGGETVYIDGLNFGNNPSAISVTIGNVPATNPQIVNANTKISVISPAGSGYNLPIGVTVNGISSSNYSLFSYAGPKANDITVDLGAPHVSTPFTITGSGFGNSPTVKYGSPGMTFEQMPFTATVVNSSPTEIQCASQIGAAGGGLVYIVRNEDGSQTQPTGNLSYESPVIIPNTLRLQSNAPSSVIYATSASDTVVQFNATGVGNVAEVLQVSLGESGGPYPIQCELVSVVAFGPSGSTIQCKVPFGSGDGYHFVVSTLNQSSAEGSDTFNYPVAPKIAAVFGCNDNYPGTVCPTTGGTTLTINGADFSPTDLSVLIGGNVCRNVLFINNTTVRCTVPPGTGQNVPVVVKNGANLSLAFTGFSYSAPFVTKVQGAADSGNSTFAVSRSGMSLTIEGSNFGASGARVLVGGVLVTNVVHDLQSPHTKLTFPCPARSTPPFYDLPVSVISAGGSFSVNNGTLSYE